MTDPTSRPEVRMTVLINHAFFGSSAESLLQGVDLQRLQQLGLTSHLAGNSEPGPGVRMSNISDPEVTVKTVGETRKEVTPPKGPVDQQITVRLALRGEDEKCESITALVDSGFEYPRPMLDLSLAQTLGTIKEYTGGLSAVTFNNITAKPRGTITLSCSDGTNSFDTECHVFDKIEQGMIVSPEFARLHELPVCQAFSAAPVKSKIVQNKQTQDEGEEEEKKKKKQEKEAAELERSREKQQAASEPSKQGDQKNA